MSTKPRRLMEAYDIVTKMFHLVLRTLNRRILQKCSIVILEFVGLVPNTLQKNTSMILQLNVLVCPRLSILYGIPNKESPGQDYRPLMLQHRNR